MKYSSLALLLCALAPWALQAADLTPAASRLLVADAALTDANFAKTVVLLLRHDEDGSLGLVLNQEADVQPSMLMPTVRGLDRYESGLFIGGPVDLRHVSVLSSVAEGGQAVLDGVYLSDDPQTLEALLQAGLVGASQMRIFVGYAGWAPGQLDAEIAAGGWGVHEGNARLVFGAPGAVWESLQDGGRAPSPATRGRVPEEPLLTGVSFGATVASGR